MGRSGSSFESGKGSKRYMQRRCSYSVGLAGRCAAPLGKTGRVRVRGTLSAVGSGGAADFRCCEYDATRASGSEMDGNSNRRSELTWLRRRRRLLETRNLSSVVRLQRPPARQIPITTFRRRRQSLATARSKDADLSQRPVTWTTAVMFEIQSLENLQLALVHVPRYVGYLTNVVHP